MYYITVTKKKTLMKKYVTDKCKIQCKFFANYLLCPFLACKINLSCVSHYEKIACINYVQYKYKINIKRINKPTIFCFYCTYT